MNIQKQIDYWVNGSKEDLISAELLISNNRILHGLFWCHLSIEKIIKAHVVRCTLQIPPRSHNLIWLLDKTEINLTGDQEKLIGELMVYQLEGRYPESFPGPPSPTKAKNMYFSTKDFHTCLMNKF